MSENTVTIALVQMRCSADPRGNLTSAVSRIEEASKRGARIVCLQELFSARYFCQREDPAVFDLAEPIPGPTTEALQQAASRHGVVIVGSIFEKRAEGVFHNTAVTIDTDGSLAGVYRKMHIPEDPLYYEKYYFSPGDLGYGAVSTQVARIGTLVCWDQWFPEAARLTALHGAEILFYPTAIGWHPSEKAEFGSQQHSAWETVQRAHAIANGVFVAAANRVGTEEQLEFWGASFVCDPMGKVMGKAGHVEEELVIVSCDLGQIADTRRNWPFLRDRRIDSYAGLSSRLLD